MQSVANIIKLFTGVTYDRKKFYNIAPRLEPGVSALLLYVVRLLAMFGLIRPARKKNFSIKKQMFYYRFHVLNPLLQTADGTFSGVREYQVPTS